MHPLVRMQLAEMNETLRRLALLADTDAPVLSAYLDGRTTPTEQRYALNLHYYAARSQMPSGKKADADEAFAAVMRHQKSAALPESGGQALFVRAGSSPHFCALSLTAPVQTAVSLRVGPAIYSLSEMRDNYDQFILVELGESSATLSVVELGGVTSRRTLPGAGMVLLRKTARALARRLEDDGQRRWILSAAPATSAAFSTLLPEETLDRWIDDIGDHADVLPRAIQRFLAFEESEDQALARMLPRQLADRRVARAGWPAVRAALKEGAAGRVLIASHGAQGKAGEIREEAALLAERTGARLDVVAGSHELQSVGEVACLVRSWA